jgi:hypothetical protein
MHPMQLGQSMAAQVLRVWLRRYTGARGQVCRSVSGAYPLLLGVVLEDALVEKRPDARERSLACPRGTDSRNNNNGAVRSDGTHRPTQTHSHTQTLI